MGGGSNLGETFLTDMLLTGNAKKGPVGAKKGKATFSTATKPKLRAGTGVGSRVTPSKGFDDFYGKDNNAEDESVISDLEDEYRDVVYDVDNSRALVKVADDYLDGKDEEPLLALPAPGDDLEISGGFSIDDSKSIGGASRASSNVSGISKLSNRNFVSINK